jgi:hypothetical protein
LFKKFFASEISLAFTHRGIEVSFNNRLCGNAGMICARKPNSLVAFHSLVADEDILDSINKDLLMEWVSVRKKKPHNLNHFDVTLEEEGGGRLLNVGIYRPLENTWELLIDKHNYQGCKVIAWRERASIYEGRD